MLLQTIFGHPLKCWPEHGIPIVMTDLKFMRFIAKEIFPGGSVPCDEDIVEFSQAAGFTVADKQLLDEHYVRTLDIVGHRARRASRRSGRRHLRGGLPAVHEVPGGLQ